ncbi:hypothetical protein [Massilia sp. CF038]|uniref:hypothetical protein n=1 Tax=Massilia sp. CF038 TaxID=1881045 RepID=UPI00091BFE39|nr:hypothetical protein [Massilia sp. CF038]SHH69485.1 N-terminal double-transmembrane domain-containing protein [Massilia sp. CF038]
MSLWWLATPVLLLPIWWHRQKRERAAVKPLATARFLPRSIPLHKRVWRWHDRSLLLLRCLLLATVIAWLADPAFPWRGDAVMIVPGTDSAWADKQIREAGLSDASRIALPHADAFAWLAQHEREWRAGARLLVVGNVPMPASRPRLAHSVIVRTAPALLVKSEHRVAIISKRADQWRAMFAAIEGPQRYVLQDAPDAGTELIVWDLPETPPEAMRAPLWWAGERSAFPELKNAPAAHGLHYADSAHGRLWWSANWPPGDAQAARAQFETWQRLHYPPLAWTTPSQTLAADPASHAPAGGALHYLMTIALLVLFALERMLSHAKRR